MANAFAALCTGALDCGVKAMAFSNTSLTSAANEAPLSYWPAWSFSEMVPRARSGIARRRTE